MHFDGDLLGVTHAAVEVGDQRKEEAVRLLRLAGYTVAAFPPNTLQGVDPAEVEVRLRQEGLEIIDLLKPAPPRQGRA